MAESEPVASPEREPPRVERSQSERSRAERSQSERARAGTGPAAEAPAPTSAEAVRFGEEGADPKPSEPGITAPPPAAEPAAVDRDQLHQALRDLTAAQGDLTAAKERVKRDAQRVKDETREALIGDLLPVLDNLDRSLQVEAADDALLEGVKLVRAQLEQVLLGYGLERIESVGGSFDPALHEAVAVVEVDSEGRHGMVQAEWQAGYRFGDKVLRAAKVSVGKLVPVAAGRGLPAGSRAWS
ncbi:MAG: nucleotide exchange factor GrpE [Deltaproteobacteria bacterium]|nr:nucleotide exchange factor GrpE [Deltaproteobacteria bacterium]